jgi:hypothetical protein
MFACKKRIARNEQQALKRFYRFARGIVEGECIPPFRSPSPEGERERGRKTSLSGDGLYAGTMNIAL